MKHRYKIIHEDFRRCVFTIERAGFSRHWTPYAVITCETLACFRAGDVIEVVR